MVQAARLSQPEKSQADLGLHRYSLLSDMQTKPQSFKVVRTIESLQLERKNEPMCGLGQM